MPDLLTSSPEGKKKCQKKRTRKEEKGWGKEEKYM